MAGHSYTFKDGDIKTITSLGYQLFGIEKKHFKKFMNDYYPAFDLAKLLIEIEQLMAPQTVLPLTRMISVANEDLHLELYNEHNGNEDIALIFDRLFYRTSGSIYVNHNYLVFPAPARKKGLSKKVLKASLQQYISTRVKIVYVTAGLSGGAYVWAKYGFVAINKSEMNNILVRAKTMLTSEQYSAVQAVYNNYYRKHPAGDAFPIYQWADMNFMSNVLMDGKSQWDGRLDLENDKQLRRFEYYVSN